jgi:hypothetical protein
LTSATNLHESPASGGRGDLDAPDRVEALAILGRKPDHERKIAVAPGFVKISRGLAADGGLDGGVDVAGRQAITRRAGTVDVDGHGRLPQDIEHREIGDPSHLGHRRFDLGGGPFKDLEVVAVQLDRILALHARGGLLDVILDVLGKIEIDARKFRFEPPLDLIGELHLVRTRRPAREGPQRHKEFGVEESGRVGSVVRPAMLGNDRGNLRIAFDQPPHAVDVAITLLEGDRRRHGRPDPKIALLEMRQKFRTEAEARRERQYQQQAGAAQGEQSVVQSEGNDRRVNTPQAANGEGLDLPDLFGQSERRERGRHQERRDQATGDGVAIGLGHGSEDMTFDTAHGEQRHEAGDDDGGGEKDRAVDLARRRGDDGEFAARSGRRRGSA